VNGADVWVLTSTVVRFWGRVQSRRGGGKNICGNQAPPITSSWGREVIADVSQLPLLTERANLTLGRECYACPTDDFATVRVRVPMGGQGRSGAQS
jgi:hypothetical protein